MSKGLQAGSNSYGGTRRGPPPECAGRRLPTVSGLCARLRGSVISQRTNDTTRLGGESTVCTGRLRGVPALLTGSTACHYVACARKDAKIDLHPVFPKQWYILFA